MTTETVTTIKVMQTPKEPELRNQLWASVFLAPENLQERQLFAEMLVRHKCSEAKSPDEADFVLFGGGSDVSPILYDEKPHSSVRSDIERDRREAALFDYCEVRGIPMVGICRGAQLLHVLNGGKLYQDVDKHYGDHSIYVPALKRQITKVSSVHHQMVVPPEGGGKMEVLAYLWGKSTTRWLSPTLKDVGTTRDVEVFWYENTSCLGFQGHPEYRGYEEYQEYFFDEIANKIMENPSISLQSVPGVASKVKYYRRTDAWNAFINKKGVN